MSEGTYLQINLAAYKNLAYLGINSKKKNGFVGDIREFFFSATFVPSSNINSLRNQVFLFSGEYLSYYRLKDGQLNEAQSYYFAETIVTNSSLPVAVWDSLPND